MQGGKNDQPSKQQRQSQHVDREQSKSRMSESAAPMLNPCKPHKPSGKGARLRSWATWHLAGRRETWHRTLISNESGCVQTFSTCSSLSPAGSYLQPRASKLSQSPSSATMSLAPSIPSIKMKVGSVRSPHRVCRPFVVIRSSKAEGPIRRPAAPPLSPPPPMPPKTPALSKPPTLSQPPKPDAPTSSPQPTSSPPQPKPVEAAAPAATVQRPVAGAVTLEYQRKVAKELQDYFKQKKLEEADQGPFFGFLPKNEISNGRWAMFGFAVGMLTEYATGSDFVQQVKILLSNFGIVDLD